MELDMPYTTPAQRRLIDSPSCSMTSLGMFAVSRQEAYTIVVLTSAACTKEPSLMYLLILAAYIVDVYVLM